MGTVTVGEATKELTQHGIGLISGDCYLGGGFAGIMDPDTKILLNLYYLERGTIHVVGVAWVGGAHVQDMTLVYVEHHLPLNRPCVEIVQGSL